MFRSCMFCHWDLGRNDDVPELPFGRVAAFEAARGRLWVVCEHCAGWNLVPIEERWEAIERCEAQYRTSPRRFSSGEIGMAVAASGMRFIRIGAATPHEFACWRYEPRFRRRRLRSGARAVGTATAGGVGLALLGGTAYLSASLVVTTWLGLLALASVPSRKSDLIAVVPEEGGSGRVFRGELRHLRFVREEGKRYLRIGSGYMSMLIGEVDITDALGLVLPQVNRRGGRPSEVARATNAITDAGGVEPYLEGFMRDRAVISNLGPASSLGLEMAAHESIEATALTGELRVLKRRWAGAEELAAISDGLFADQEERLLSRLKGDLTPVSWSS